MNINKAIEFILLNLSKKYKIFYMERITYKKFKSYKSYYIRIEYKDDILAKDFNSKLKLLEYLMEFDKNERR